MNAISMIFEGTKLVGKLMSLYFNWRENEALRDYGKEMQELMEEVRRKDDALTEKEIEKAVFGD